jgi:hypothetical protein
MFPPFFPKHIQSSKAVLPPVTLSASNAHSSPLHLIGA